MEEFIRECSWDQRERKGRTQHCTERSWVLLPYMWRPGLTVWVVLKPVWHLRTDSSAGSRQAFAPLCWMAISYEQLPERGMTLGKETLQQGQSFVAKRKCGWCIRTHLETSNNGWVLLNSEVSYFPEKPFLSPLSEVGLPCYYASRVFSKAHTTICNYSYFIFQYTLASPTTLNLKGTCFISRLYLQIFHSPWHTVNTQ